MADTEDIKRLARLGAFDEIGRLYGEAWAVKAAKAIEKKKAEKVAAAGLTGPLTGPQGGSHRKGKGSTAAEADTVADSMQAAVILVSPAAASAAAPSVTAPSAPGANARAAAAVAPRGGSPTATAAADTDTPVVAGSDSALAIDIPCAPSAAAPAEAAEKAAPGAAAPAAVLLLKKRSKPKPHPPAASAATEDAVDAGDAASLVTADAAPASAKPGVSLSGGSGWKTTKTKKPASLSLGPAASKAKEGPLNAPKKPAKGKGSAPPAAVGAAVVANAYMLFCAETRESVRAAAPELTFAEVGKELGRLWKEQKAADPAFEGRYRALAAAKTAENKAAAAAGGSGASSKTSAVPTSKPACVGGSASNKKPQAAGAETALAPSSGAAPRKADSQKKRKTGSTHRRVGAGGDDDEAEAVRSACSSETDEDDKLPVRDLRAEMIAEARRRLKLKRAAAAAANSGDVTMAMKTPGLKHGAIDIDDFSADSRVPHMEGRFNYAPFTGFRRGDRVTLVLPAWYDFLAQTAASTADPDASDELDETAMGSVCDEKDSAALDAAGAQGLSTAESLKRLQQLLLAHQHQAGAGAQEALRACRGNTSNARTRGVGGDCSGRIRGPALPASDAETGGLPLPADFHVDLSGLHTLTKYGAVFCTVVGIHTVSDEDKGAEEEGVNALPRPQSKAAASAAEDHPSGKAASSPTEDDEDLESVLSLVEDMDDGTITDPHKLLAALDASAKADSQSNGLPQKARPAKRPAKREPWRLMTLHVHPLLSATCGLEEDEDVAEAIDVRPLIAASAAADSSAAASSSSASGSFMKSASDASEDAFDVFFGSQEVPGANGDVINDSQSLCGSQAEAEGSMDGAPWTAAGLVGKTAQAGDLFITIPWLPPQDSRMGNPYLLHADRYVKSIATRLDAGTQTRIMFALPDDPSRGEWVEGRVMGIEPRKQDKQRGWTKCHYQAIHTIWYEQDLLTLQWYIDIVQSDTTASPWDIQIERNPFVHPDNVRAFCNKTPALGSPDAVLKYLNGLEVSIPFKTLVPKSSCPHYYTRIKNPISLACMGKRLRDGLYNEPGAAGAESGNASNKQPRGIQGLWDDIKLLIRNAKVFNVPISYVHHLARGLEFEIRRLKRKYGSAMPPAAEAMNGDADGNEHPAAGSGLKPKAALGASLGKRKRPLELEDSKTRPLEGEAIAANVQDSTLIGAAMAAGDDGECVDDPGKDAVMVEPAEKKARFSED